jgi:hypothetical protein
MMTLRGEGFVPTLLGTVPLDGPDREQPADSP